VAPFDRVVGASAATHLALACLATVAKQPFPSVNDSRDTPPEDLVSFLVWLRERTERAWTYIPPPKLEDFVRRGVGGRSWQNGTKWQSGFSDEQLDRAQRQWGVEFPQEYRTFLQVLGTPTKPMFRAGFQGANLVASEGPSFYDWSQDDDVITGICNAPLEGVLFDVEENGHWLAAWGDRPESKDQRRTHITRLVDAAPKLVPVIGHRYLAHAPAAPKGYVVLSVMQTDIITYGIDLRSFLLQELSGLIGTGISYQQSVAGITEHMIRSIAFWGELIG
jgi:hypothetical protein